VALNASRLRRLDPDEAVEYERAIKLDQVIQPSS
jgi:hypothetical protein